MKQPPPEWCVRCGSPIRCRVNDDRQVCANGCTGFLVWIADERVEMTAGDLMAMVRGLTLPEAGERLRAYRDAHASKGNRLPALFAPPETRWATA